MYKEKKNIFVLLFIDRILREQYPFFSSSLKKIINYVYNMRIKSYRVL